MNPEKGVERVTLKPGYFMIRNVNPEKGVESSSLHTSTIHPSIGIPKRELKAASTRPDPPPPRRNPEKGVESSSMGRGRSSGEIGIPKRELKDCRRLCCLQNIGRIPKRELKERQGGQRS